MASKILYGSAIIATAGIFGTAAYALGSELFATNGAYSLVDRAVNRLQSDHRLVDRLGGLPLTVYGCGGYRRRPVITHGHAKDASGRAHKTIETVFYVRGHEMPQLQARVVCRAVQMSNGQWKDSYLEANIDNERRPFIYTNADRPRSIFASRKG